MAKSELEQALGNMIKFFGPVVQTKVMRKIAGYMAKVNRKRMRTNITPDGSAMQKRSGIPVNMTYAEYMKSIWKRPAKKLDKSSKGTVPLKIYLSKIKRAKKKMFSRHEKENGGISKGMGSALRESAESGKAQAYFSGAIGNTALDHQYGRRVTVGESSFNEPMRELLGLPIQDQQAIVQIIQENLEFFISTGKLKSVRSNNGN